jgi:flagellar export protein FliJ
MTGKFKFRLATLLRLRDAARQDRRAELAEAYRLDDVLQQQLGRVEDELDRLRVQCRKTAGPGEVDVDRLLEAKRYEVALRTQELQIVKQRETVQAEIQRRRQNLLDANREVRVLENLRDKQALQYRLEDERRESKRLDEVAQQQALREVAL